MEFACKNIGNGEQRQMGSTLTLKRWNEITQERLRLRSRLASRQRVSLMWLHNNTVIFISSHQNINLNIKTLFLLMFTLVVQQENPIFYFLLKLCLLNQLYIQRSQAFAIATHALLHKCRDGLWNELVSIMNWFIVSIMFYIITRHTLHLYT